MSALSSIPSAPSAARLRHSALTRAGWLAAGASAIAALGLISVAVGVRSVPLADVMAIVTHSGSADIDPVDAAAVTKRIPRTALALAAGAGLGVAGTAMQAVTRNPLADPGILGVSQGAALAVVCGMAFFSLTTPAAYIWVALAGAGVAAVFVYAIGSLGPGGATPLKLALSGAAISAALTSLISAVLLPRVDVMSGFQFWQIGGVGGATWDNLALLAPFLAVGIGIVLLAGQAMNSLALGDEMATALGTRVMAARMTVAAGAVILTGAITAIAGPIGFVGLMVPHLTRTLVGTDHRWLTPAAALTGGALVIGADVIGRVVARPEELQVGIVTAALGAPVFIWIVQRHRVREL